MQEELLPVFLKVREAINLDKLYNIGITIFCLECLKFTLVDFIK